LAERVELQKRQARFAESSNDQLFPEALSRAQSIGHPHLAAARERYDRVASAVAIEPRDPFLDIRLITFCLSLPPSQLQANGWPKIILRHTMTKRLPQSVIWRRGKEHLGWSFTKAVFAGWTGWEDVLSRDAERIAIYAKMEPKSHRDREPMDIERRIRLFSLLRWIILRRGSFGP
jgi:asparagine synthase (glutamine-hydrolysing)